MYKIPISVNSWIFGKRPIAEIIKRVKDIGADGIDINGEPESIDTKETTKILEEYNVIPFCVNGNYLVPERTLCHSDSKIRSTAVDYVKKLVDMAAELGATRIVVVPNMIPTIGYHVSQEKDWENAVKSMEIIGQYAKDTSVKVLIEAVNKYEVTLVRTIEDAVKMAKQTGQNNIRVVADTFHMCLEEPTGIYSALWDTQKGWIDYLHIGENTREVPGRGTINWRNILQVLRKTEFQGALSLEPLVNRMSADEMTSGLMPADLLDKELKMGVDYLRNEMLYL